MLANISTERPSFRNIQSLPPGCALSLHRDKKRLWRYWQTDHVPELRLGSPEEYLDCFREKFDQAVRVRLRAPGRVGAQLRGGLDSGAVAPAAAPLLCGC